MLESDRTPLLQIVVVDSLMAPFGQLALLTIMPREGYAALTSATHPQARTASRSPDLKQTMLGQANAVIVSSFFIEKILEHFKSTLGNIPLDPSILNQTMKNVCD